MKSVFIYCIHGSYGRDDDAYGALLVANAALAKGMRATLALVDDGVYMAKKGQNPGKIGLPNNLDELNDFTELGGRLIALQESLEERGIQRDELVDGAEVISMKDMVEIIEQHSHSLTF